MNINSAIPMPLKPQVLVQAATPRPTEALSSNALKDQEKKEAFAKAFYTREEEPWKGKLYNIRKNTTDDVREQTKDEYLGFLKLKIYREIDNQSHMYNQFRRSVMDMRPDLAGTHFSFTLGDDAELKIIDPEKKLNEDDFRWLTKSINSNTDFKDSARTFAKLVMTAIDHDSKKFSEKNTLNLLNFQDTIDLGAILMDSNNNTSDRWMKQIKGNDVTRESSLVDTYA